MMKSLFPSALVISGLAFGFGFSSVTRADDAVKAPAEAKAEKKCDCDQECDCSKCKMKRSKKKCKDCDVKKHNEHSGENHDHAE